MAIKNKKNQAGVSPEVRLVTGQGMWHTDSYDGQLPAIHLADGPHGLRAQDDGSQVNDSFEATCFPTASCSACSWDPNLLEAMGAGIAKEAKARKVSVVLGPGVNMKRSPLCGRNFEYFSEDPYLAGSMATAWVNGAQGQGVGTSLKHFAANNQETYRMMANSQIDERTLHEVYLGAWEQTVKAAQPATVMGCYNRVNGSNGCENKYLITDVLRGQWGFEGLVVSDWGACVDLPACLQAGLDLEMPDSNGNHGKKLMEALEAEKEAMAAAYATEENEEVAAAEDDEKDEEEAIAAEDGEKEEVESVAAENDEKDEAEAVVAEDDEKDEVKDTVLEGPLAMSLKRAVANISKLANTYAPEPGEDKECPKELRLQNHKLAEKIAENSAVLLTNDGILPLKAGSKVLVVGALAAEPRYQGGGSSHIHTEHVCELEKAWKRCGIEATFVKGYDANQDEVSSKLEEEAFRQAMHAKEQGMPILFFGGLTDRAEGEGYDRQTFDMPENQKHLLQRLFKVTRNIVFVSFSGAPYDMSPAKSARAILQMYLAGEASLAACARLLTGKANPSGKLAETWPKKLEDVPCNGYFALQGDMVNHPLDVEYREGMFMGYRYYDTYKVPVQYAFGHGLSYSHFAVSNPRITVMETGEAAHQMGNFDPLVMVEVSVTNTSLRAGKEVVQVYVKPEKQEGKYLRPARVLGGFRKVALEAGETKRILIPIPKRAFQVYVDCTMNVEPAVEQNGFVLAGGAYRIEIGNAIDNLILKNRVEIDGYTITGNEKVPAHIPMTEEEFQVICPNDFDFSHIKPGEYSMKNSINQLAETSSQAKALKQFVKSMMRTRYWNKSPEDPDLKMMLEFALDGCADSIVGQSGGMIPYGLVEKLVDIANGGEE